MKKKRDTDNNIIMHHCDKILVTAHAEQSIISVMQTLVLPLEPQLSLLAI